MVVTPPDVLPAAEKHLPLRKMLSVGLGNALEFYDFIAFAFFATQIARTFFPASQTSVAFGLMAQLGVGPGA